ncbi:MAG TPA: prepilin-type N-terminal cleavage/methylation domain-containing protein [Candidatus Binatia bacterium]|jgi:Tfp pilus assembly protein PilV|nr:prepilin-type N-terminal cleavage/methylation domain-containing protein [Candidatus Binatia bacterium]
MTLQKKNEGFTLVEILIAVTIFTFAVLGLAIGTVSVIQTNQTSHLRASAVNLAQARLEELRAMTSTAFSGLACPNSTPCSDSPVASGVTFTRQWWITTNSPVAGVNQIDVRINWTDYTNQTMSFTASVPQ